ncbi:hypothetical protein C1H57_03215 [Clostridium sp. 2-1]|uniref:Flagellar biosynthesis anti-sigma factor FlgM n=1 Tax=Candidatus Clostridium helianthi TaxID=3381660 RepID=A0ABW8S160_9CLOT|nr:MULTISPECIES: hypothetical protein [Clostridium]MBN7573988.1 hypothetical protein [Clostridium beijerinckii]MBN7577668.1 hypothetical protein [Clostridium beijerinckii]MBN7583738.1 hypothetical protein [Clostridium beijerinckii]MBO0519840.1 hypothetical protein [Clostridium beijerinckii]POO92827.1 hypothetical protein C1H57_03215 [Clostridium sp. 2-1]
MSDNRIISRSEYIVASVSGAAIDNKIIKRPYTNPRNPSNKKQNNAKSFDNTLHSSASQSSNDSQASFSNELENMARLKSEENSRLVQAKFNNKIKDSETSDKNPAQTELHNKLAQAMDVEVDVSTIYKKVQLLNSLKNESNN